MNWIAPKAIVGPQATGDYYFHRANIVADIWDAIDRGKHVLLAAPRRVGKSSVMVYMTENCDENVKCVFKNIQGINSEQEFYQQVYGLILSCLRQDKKLWTKIGDFLKGITVEEVGAEGTLKFGDRKNLDFLDEINHIVRKLPAIKVVLFIDELPEVLHKLHKNNKTEEASNIIKNLRIWRQEKTYTSLCFVLAGSVGIHHVVKTIEGRTSDLNDIQCIDFDALTSTEASDYVKWATKDATVQYNVDLQQYLLGIIQHYVPYFINLMLDQIHDTARRNNAPIISTEAIDAAFVRVAKQNDKFEDWRNRLFDYYKKSEAQFFDHILTYIAHNGSINKRQAFDISYQYELSDQCIGLLDDLANDGYVSEKDQGYTFISPFLKAFWQRYLLKKS
ncbi:MAG: hypothetical protein EAZ32_01925 [Cytophagia bacterium]|nr:MAG: hypothetical protein EAZ46_01290 [Runella sp.]TAG23004.1 MAG: hypothetical protein EAZ38_04400 [Cytophagales bacterium]TAG42058.1 MAG: hypothetical protein EAZ32_01925 [Cytophagia bacterium]TAG70455.1 MAG: hypothetical protein EAZ26_06070 [Runella slithyformis]TAG83758.1 MAG: hypothetical protein EAZ22_01990 [Cytophagales bacterium]